MTSKHQFIQRSSQKHPISRNDSASTSSTTTAESESLLYYGPILPPELDTGIIAGITLAELGLDIAIAPSIAVPAQLGLYVRLTDNVDSVTLPSMTLLCGYAKHGTFQSSRAVNNHGGKTVGFAIPSAHTAVFLDQKLMSIADALEYAARVYGDGSCGLMGHDLRMNDDTSEIIIAPVDQHGFARFFAPDMVQRVLHNEDVKVEEFVVANFGQYANDLAWDAANPPHTQEEYKLRSQSNNVLQLVWRVEYDADKKSLVPSWPVSIISRDVTFENGGEFMEVGACYGWNYWQAATAGAGRNA